MKKSKKISKPWGFEEIIDVNKKYMFKRLFMKKGHRCSLQFHKKKKETIFILRGALKIITGKSLNNLKSKIYKKNEFITIAPKIIHRMEGQTNCVYLEASSPEIKDVVRLKDDYKRVKLN